MSTLLFKHSLLESSYPIIVSDSITLIVNNALTSRFQSTYDDDNIDDDDVSIWPPIHLLILKALRIIALHYVDTH